MEDYIVVKNARLHNLRNVSVSIPIGKITLVSGVSGSGKSTLAFDILGKILRQKYLDLLGGTVQRSEPLLLKAEEYVDFIEPLCPVILFKGQVLQKNPHSTVGTTTGLTRLLRNLFCFCGKYICPECGGTLKASEPEQIVASVLDLGRDKRIIVKAPLSLPPSLEERRMAILRLHGEGYLRVEAGGRIFMLDEEIEELHQALNQNDGQANLVVDRIKLEEGKIQRLFDSIRTALVEGDGKVAVDIEFGRGKFETFYFSTRLWCFKCLEAFLDPLEKTGKASHGASLREAALVFLGKEFDEILDESISHVAGLLEEAEKEGLIKQHEVTYPLFKKILSQLRAFRRLGIGYLSLSRPVTQVSTGEFLKLRLGSLIAQRCVGVLFILDEPVSILPSKERRVVCRFVEHLKGEGNTVVMIEHAPEAVAIADYLIEMGPGGGEQGGNILRQQWLQENTRQGLIEELNSAVSKVQFDAEKVFHGSITVPLSRYFHPEKEIKIKRGGLNVVSGPTGSGKSRLLSEIKVFLQERFSHNHFVVDVPQGDIFRNRYSMPCTVLNVFGKIRGLFSKTKEARSYGLTSELFSLSKKGGRCEMCKGTGYVEKEGFGYLVSYLCPLCKGARYNPDILRILYKGLSIGDILDLSINEAAGFFSNISAIRSPLEIAERVGLGYLMLGQPVSSLSSGEAQRLKIASHLARKGMRRQSFFLMDQPTAGLHPKDLASLVDFFRQLVLLGSTLVIADNNPVILDSSAHEIRLEGSGPEGGRISRG